jgi:hypothetical protein
MTSDALDSTIAPRRSRPGASSVPDEIRWPKAWAMRSPLSRPGVLPVLKERGRVLLLQIGTLASDARGLLRGMSTTRGPRSTSGASSIRRSRSGIARP